MTEYWKKIGSDNLVLKEKYNAAWIISKSKNKVIEFPIWNQDIVIKTNIVKKKIASVIVETIGEDTKGNILFIDKTKLMPGRIMVGLVVLGTILGFFGLYQPFIEFAGAGASVPLIGFGNTLIKGVKESVDKEGILGVFMGGFKASAVGISSALIFGFIASLMFKSKMKD